MNKEALLALADKLDALPWNRFNFGRWTERVSHGAAQFDPNLQQRISPSCGTTACALGWAADGDPRCCFVCDTTGIWWVALREDVGELDVGLMPPRVSAELFGLTPEEHYWVFLPDENRRGDGRPNAHAGPREVAAHIRLFVERGGVPDGWRSDSDNWFDE